MDIHNKITFQDISPLSNHSPIDYHFFIMAARLHRTGPSVSIHIPATPASLQRLGHEKTLLPLTIATPANSLEQESPLRVNAWSLHVSVDEVRNQKEESAATQMSEVDFMDCDEPLTSSRSEDHSLHFT